MQDTGGRPATPPEATEANKPLRVNGAGLDLICERLRAANRNNPEVGPQCDRLLAAVRQALDGLLLHFPGEIERVLARGEWALDGFDLRTLRDVEDVYLEIVVRTEELEFSLARRISAEVFADVQHRYNGSFCSSSRCSPCRSGIVSPS